MFCISLSSQRNPSAEYWISYTYNPKKGMTEEFEKAVAEKTKKFNSSEENAFFTFQTLTGNQQGAYQRWQVRKSVGYFDPWDGNNMNGKPLRDGTYFYVIKLRDGIDPIKGTVSIIR